MGAAIPLLMKTPRSCHQFMPPKASPGPFLVPMPCDDLRKYRRDPATRPSPEVGILASEGCGQPYGCGRDVTAAGSATGAAVLPTATFVPASPAGGSTG